mgnify:CR=1 FL=1
MEKTPVKTLAAVLALFLAMDMLRIFGGAQLLGSLISLETHYFFALLGLLLPMAFLNYLLWVVIPFLRDHKSLVKAAGRGTNIAQQLARDLREAFERAGLLFVGR